MFCGYNKHDLVSHFRVQLFVYVLMLIYFQAFVLIIL